MKKNDTSKGQNAPLSPDSPKIRIVRLIVGAVIITLGIIIFNITSKMYKEVYADDVAKEKMEKARVDSINRAVGEPVK